MPVNPVVTVVICTRSRSRKLERCLDSIKHSTYKDFRVIVVDQTPRQKWSLGISTSHPNIRYLPTNTIGLALARNLGVSLCSSELVAFTDDDCIVEPTWLAKVVECFESYPDVIGVFGRVLAWPRGGEKLNYVHTVTKLGTTTYCSTASGLQCFALTDLPVINIARTPCLPYANLGSGNNMAFRLSWLEEFGGFIEQLGAGTSLYSAEDTELQYRALRRGFTLLYSPEPLVFHDRWLTPKDAARVMDGYLVGVLATFAFYALQADAFAARILWFEFATAISDCLKLAQTNKALALKRCVSVIRSCLQGIGGGIRLRFTRRYIRHFRAQRGF